MSLAAGSVTVMAADGRVAEDHRAHELRERRGGRHRLEAPERAAEPSPLVGLACVEILAARSY